MNELDMKRLFLGTRGENAAMLLELSRRVIESAAEWRNGLAPLAGLSTMPPLKEPLAEEGPKAAAPPDPPSKLPGSSPTLTSMQLSSEADTLKSQMGKLLGYLQRSIPIFSPGYHGHMGWDLILPGILGNMTGLLYNSNNVAYEGSPATTILEKLACQDLCRMLGFRFDREVKPWGHMVAGGTVANIEALWAARNVKFLPLAIRQALRNWPGDTRAAEQSMVTVKGSQKQFRDLDDWELLNLELDESLALLSRIKGALNLKEKRSEDRREKVSSEDFDVLVSRHGMNTLGLQRISESSKATPRILLSHDNHYSLEKGPALLGLGQDCLDFVPVDAFGGMKIGGLQERLWHCLKNEIPVLAVVANLGSTELGAVDPLDEILALREAFRHRGLDFMVHVDAAFGGYLASMFRPEFQMGSDPSDEVAYEAVGLSDYVRSQYKVLAQADSITVDPHKLGFIPFPAGAICYRNSALRDLTRFSAPYLGSVVSQGIGQINDATDQLMGVYGVEGSRPGGAASAVFLSHRVVRPDVSGYGKLCTLEMDNCKNTYRALLGLNDGNQNWKVAAAGVYPDGIKDAAVMEPHRRAEGKAGESRNWGPDLNMMCYMFNFLVDGQANNEILWLNVYNMAMYGQIGLNPRSENGGKIQPFADRKLIVANTIFSGGEGTDFLKCMLQRLGLDTDSDLSRTDSELKDVELFALRSAEWNPWHGDGETGRFMETLKEIAGNTRALVVRARTLVKDKAVLKGMRDLGHSEFDLAVAIAFFLKRQLEKIGFSGVMESNDPIGAAEIFMGWREFRNTLALTGIAEIDLDYFNRN